MNLYQPAAVAAVVTETMGETEIIIIGNSIFVIPFTELHKDEVNTVKNESWAQIDLAYLFQGYC